jgi:hypothetical protein
MPLSRVLKAVVVIVLCLCSHGAVAQPAPPGARLVFSHAEPVEQSVQVRDEKYRVMNLKLWFRNDGRSTARLHTIAIMPLLTAKLLTPAEEDNDFGVAATQWSIVVNGEVKPGESASFASRNGVDDEGWTEFQAARKYLYSFLTLSYGSEGSKSQDETLTEMCVWFQNGDIKTLNECQSGHNQVRRKGN